MALLNAGTKLVEALTFLRDNLDALRAILATRPPASASSATSVVLRRPPIASPPVFAIVKIDSVVTVESVGSIGFYKARFIRGAAPDPTGDVAVGDWGTLATNVEVIVVNQAQTMGGGGFAKGAFVSVLMFGALTIEESSGSSGGTAPRRYPYGIPLQQPSGMFVKVISAASGGGKYNGRIWHPPTGALAATGNVAEADLGVTGETDVLIFNGAEVGVSTHDLTTGSPKSKIFPAVHLGGTVADPPVQVFGINGVDWENCA